MDDDDDKVKIVLTQKELSCAIHAAHVLFDKWNSYPIRDNMDVIGNVIAKLTEAQWRPEYVIVPNPHTPDTPAPS